MYLEYVVHCQQPLHIIVSLHLCCNAPPCITPSSRAHKVLYQHQYTKKKELIKQLDVSPKMWLTYRAALQNRYPTAVPRVNKNDRVRTFIMLTSKPIRKPQWRALFANPACLQAHKLFSAAAWNEKVAIVEQPKHMFFFLGFF